MLLLPVLHDGRVTARRYARWQVVWIVMACLGAAVPPERASCQEPLTLSRAIATALANSPQLAVAKNARRASESARSELSTQALPQFKAGFSSLYAPSSSTLGYDPVITNEGQLSGQVFLQQSLYDGGMRGVRSDQLSLDITGSDLAQQSVARDITYSVRVAFIDILRYQAEVALRQQAVDELRQYLELTRRRFHGGATSESDVLRTEVDLSNTLVALNQSTTSYNSARYALAELLGRTPDTNFAVAGTLDNLLDVPPDTLPGSVLDLEFARTNVERSALDVTLVEREAYPLLSFIADAGVLTSIENLRLPSGDRASSLGYSVGIFLELPIFDWGGRNLRKAQKELEFSSLSIGTTALERKLRSEMARLRMERRSAQDRLETLRENSAKARDLFLVTKARYAGGGALAVEVLGAQQLANDTEVASLQTLAEIQTLSARIIQLTTRGER